MGAPLQNLTADFASLISSPVAPSLESAWAALEADDTLDAHLVDQLADLMQEWEEAVEAGQNSALIIARLRATYETAVQKANWQSRAQRLSATQLQTSVYKEFQQLVAALRTRHRRLAARRLDLLQNHFQTVWSEYCGTTHVLDGEATRESALCHQFLSQGLRDWLEALSVARTGEDAARALEFAEQGQRTLIVVQILESEMATVARRFAACWN